MTLVAHQMGKRPYCRRCDAEAWLVNVRMANIDPPRDLAQVARWADQRGRRPMRTEGLMGTTEFQSVSRAR